MAHTSVPLSMRKSDSILIGIKEKTFLRQTNQTSQEILVMSTQSNEETNDAQAPAQSDHADVSVNALDDESLEDEDLEDVDGGAVVLGTGGIEVSLIPRKPRSTLLDLG